MFVDPFSFSFSIFIWSLGCFGCFRVLILGISFVAGSYEGLLLLVTLFYFGLLILWIIVAFCILSISLPTLILFLEKGIHWHYNSYVFDLISLPFLNLLKLNNNRNNKIMQDIDKITFKHIEPTLVKTSDNILFSDIQLSQVELLANSIMTDT